MTSRPEKKLNKLAWVEELLPDDIVSQRMFGGIGYYLDEKLVLILLEGNNSRLYKGIEYPFELGNGCVFPVEKIKQNTVWAKFTFLENHPANKNWLYLPADSQDLEEELQLVLREIKKRNPLFGFFAKTPRLSQDAASAMDDFFDMSKPRLFNNGPALTQSKAQDKTKIKKSTSIMALPKKKKKVKANKKPVNELLLSMLTRRSK